MEKMTLSWKRHFQNKTGWISAVVFSLVFNGALFSLMPGLIAGVADNRGDLQPLHTVNVIRIKRPEQPLRKKVIKKPEIVEKPEKKQVERELFHPKSLTRLKLPFEINPKLPVGPGIVPTLFLEKYSIHGIDAYEMGDIDHPVTPLVQVPPIYPMRARRLGIEGWVKVNIWVTAEGLVERTEVVEAQPQGIFEKSVIRCLSSWRFSPGTVDGVPVKTLLRTTIRFSLEDE